MCCILEQDTSIYGDFQRFYRPAIKALHHLGATDVIQSGRNDLTLHGKKNFWRRYDSNQQPYLWWLLSTARR